MIGVPYCHMLRSNKYIALTCSTCAAFRDFMIKLEIFSFHVRTKEIMEYPIT